MKISSQDIGKSVIYTPFEGAPPETGTIKSVNKRFAFIDFGRNCGRGTATPLDKINLIEKT